MIEEKRPGEQFEKYQFRLKRIICLHIFRTLQDRNNILIEKVFCLVQTATPSVRVNMQSTI